MNVPVYQLARWARLEVDRSKGPPRAYTGPYPDRSGPTCEHMDLVRQMALATNDSESKAL